MVSKVDLQSLVAKDSLFITEDWVREFWVEGM
jgi:hypothetical protein